MYGCWPKPHVFAAYFHGYRKPILAMQKAETVDVYLHMHRINLTNRLDYSQSAPVIPNYTSTEAQQMLASHSKPPVGQANWHLVPQI